MQVMDLNSTVPPQGAAIWILIKKFLSILEFIYSEMNKISNPKPKGWKIMNITRNKLCAM